jgi:hypothetical protein
MCEGGKEDGEEGGREEEREGGREGRRDGRDSSVWVWICVRPNVVPYYACVYRGERREERSGERRTKE